ncbi:MAG: PAS domain S-box protein [Planctomycetes bacterium]|nr:PAS domain S-box protein [Planctomycetota bacterium]
MAKTTRDAAKRRKPPRKTVPAPSKGAATAVLAPDVSTIKESREELASIIASAMDAIVTVDAAQRVTLFNAGAERMFACPAKEAIGQLLNRFIPERFRAAHSRYIEKFAATKASARSMSTQRPLAALRADGSEFPIEASISQVEVEGKKHFTAIIRDITARLVTETALREAEARFRSVFENAGIGIMMIDGNSAILEANAACEKMLGYSNAELRGTPYIKITHPQDVEMTLEHTRSITNGGGGVIEYEKRYVRKDGEQAWARVLFTMSDGSADKPHHFIKLIEDITQRKHAEAKAQRVRARNEAVLHKYARLTDREREVLWLVVNGRMTKNIATDLGTSPKTIDVHRARLMEKMEADSVAQLVQMIMPVRKSLAIRGGAAKTPTDAD